MSEKQITAQGIECASRGLSFKVFGKTDQYLKGVVNALSALEVALEQNNPGYLYSWIESLVKEVDDWKASRD